MRECLDCEWLREELAFEREANIDATRPLNQRIAQLTRTVAQLQVERDDLFESLDGAVQAMLTLQPWNRVTVCGALADAQTLLSKIAKETSQRGKNEKRMVRV